MSRRRTDAVKQAVVGLVDAIAAQGEDLDAAFQVLLAFKRALAALDGGAPTSCFDDARALLIALEAS